MPFVPSGSWRPTAPSAQTNRPRNTVEPLLRLIGHVLVVAAEELVAAISRQDDRDVFRSEFRHHEGRDRRRIAERLVEEPREVLRHIDDVGSEDQLVMLGAKRLGHAPRIPQLVEFPVGKPNRKRLDGFRSHRGHGRDNGARIDTAAEKRPDRHVAHFVELDRFTQQIAQSIDQFTLGCLFVRLKRHIPIAMDLEVADFRHRRQVPRLELPNTLHNALR